ncbi:hypothetical protein EU805_09955 [Salipiger sp. IMCC34102]|uniref:translocation/assembly module TamB domain-containing protein n=1 Tax=Salipiger sp. IMCC34102 TaxID=2510647 RepID=UPI00101DAD2B|nr:translocation/assembly module TamB domain-containing protein [Salipiger sp. IMCC34102]RYH02175.1 hypothetical protein EU805_09955 [Salipiger sp. IMCC34102]
MKKFLFAAALAALPLVGLPLATQAQDDDGEGYLTRLIQDNLSGDDRIVDITGFQGALSSRATVQSITVADSDGVWLTLDDVVLDWNRSALLRGRIDVEELSAERVRLDRMPNTSGETDLPEAEAQPFSLPELPVGIELGQLDIQRIELGEPIVGEPLALSLTGSASLAGGEGTTNIEARRIDGKTGLFAIEGAYDNESRVLGLNLAIEEGEDGLIARLANIPDRPSLSLTVQGEAPLSEFEATLALATSGEDRIAGNFALNQTDGQTGYALDIGGDLTPLLADQYDGFFGSDVSLVATGARGDDGAFVLSDLDLSADRLNLAGEIRVDAGGWAELIDLTGTIEDVSGEPVLLPIGGAPTYVDRVDLSVQFDDTTGDDWTADFDILGFDRPGLGIAEITLTGGGTIREDTETDPGLFTADLGYAATGLQLDDAGAAEAFGDSLDGQIVVRRVPGTPTEIPTLTLMGPGIELDAEAQVDTAGEGVVITTQLDFDADAIGRFSTLAGRDLNGAAEATVNATIQPLDGMFDIEIDAQTQDLAVDIEELDPVLAGTGTVAITAVRDTEGTRVPNLRIETPEALVTARANLTSAISTGNFNISVENVGLIVEGLDGPAQIVGEADRDEAGLVNFDITGTAPQTEFAATGTAAPMDDTQRITATLTATAGDLSAFSEIVERDLGGSIDLTVQGSALADATEADVTLEATMEDLQTGVEQLDPLLVGPGSLSGRFGVTDGTIYSVEGLDLNTPQLTVTGDASGGLEGPANADLDLRVADVALVVDGLSGPLTAQVDAQRNADETADIVLTATGPGVDIDADVTVDTPTNGYGIAGRISAQVPDLAPYAALGGQEQIAGGVDLTLDGSLQPDLSLFDVTLDGTLQDLQTGVAQLDPLLQGPGRLSGSVARTAEDRFSVTGLDLATPQLTVTGDASGGLTGEAEADLDLRIADVGLVVDGLTGPLTAQVDLDREADEVADVVLRANGPGVDIVADVTVAAPADGYAIAGEISAEVPDLAPYAALAGQDQIAGGVDIDLVGTLEPDLSLFDVTVDGTTDGLQVGIAQVDTLIAGQGRIEGSIARDGPDSFAVSDLSLVTPQLTVEGSASGGMTGPLSADIDAILKDAGALATGLNGALTLDLQASRDATGTAQIDLTAQGSGTDVTVDAQVAPQEDDYRVTADLDASVANLSQFSQLAGLPISGALDVTAQGTVMPDFSLLDVQARAQTQGLAIGNPQVDQLLAGTGTVQIDARKDGNDITVRSFDVNFPQVSASGSLDAGTQGSASGTVQARLADVGLFTDVLSGPVTAQGQIGRAATGAITLDIDATGPGGITASAAGTVQPGGDLDIDADGQVPLGLANTFIDPQRLDGLARFDLSVNGPPALTSITGQVTTAGARLAVPAISEALENINATIRLNGSEAQVDATATVQSGGDVQLGGPIALTGGYDAALDLAFQRVVARDPELYEAILFGNIAVDGALTGGALISGEVTVAEANVQVPSSGVGSLGELPEVTHLNASAPVRLTLDRADVALDGGAASEAGDGGGGPVYPLDLTVRAPNQIFIRGRGLDAELGGELSLGGTTANIVPVGQFDLVRGRVDILQQRFELTEGSATLQGDFVPYLRLVAATETDTGTVVRIVVEGPANSPEVSFESTPQLPQDEVLAQLIFGRDLSEISPFQAVQLAAAVGQLAGRGGGGLIDGFRQNLGLDDFDVTTDDEGNAALRAGKYLSDNLYTDVTLGSDGSTEINLNLDITDEITAKGTAGADGETSIGIFFERDY